MGTVPIAMCWMQGLLPGMKILWGKLNFQLLVCAGIRCTGNVDQHTVQTDRFHGLCVFNFLYETVYLGVCIPSPSCTHCYSAIPQDLSATEIVTVQWNCNCIRKCAVADGCSWQYVLVYVYTISRQQLQSISCQQYRVSNIQSQYPVSNCLIRTPWGRNVAQFFYWSRICENRTFITWSDHFGLLLSIHNILILKTN